MDKLRLVLAAALICLALSTVALAAFWIYSPILPVTVGYKLGLDYALSGSNITLTANLTQHISTGWIPISGAVIYFYNCTSGGSILNLLGSSNTDSQGLATCVYSADHDASYYFKAGYQVP